MLNEGLSGLDTLPESQANLVLEETIGRVDGGLKGLMTSALAMNGGPLGATVARKVPGSASVTETLQLTCTMT